MKKVLVAVLALLVAASGVRAAKANEGLQIYPQPTQWETGNCDAPFPETWDDVWIIVVAVTQVHQEIGSDITPTYDILECIAFVDTAVEAKKAAKDYSENGVGLEYSNGTMTWFRYFGPGRVSHVTTSPYAH